MISMDANFGRDGRALDRERRRRGGPIKFRGRRPANALFPRSFDHEYAPSNICYQIVALSYASISNCTTKVRLQRSLAGVYRAQHDTSFALCPVHARVCCSRRAQMARGCGASRAVRACAVRCARAGALARRGSSNSATPTLASLKGHYSPLLGLIRVGTDSSCHDHQLNALRPGAGWGKVGEGLLWRPGAGS